MWSEKGQLIDLKVTDRVQNNVLIKNIANRQMKSVNVPKDTGTITFFGTLFIFCFSKKQNKPTDNKRSRGFFEK